MSQSGALFLVGCVEIARKLLFGPMSPASEGVEREEDYSSMVGQIAGNPPCGQACSFMSSSIRPESMKNKAEAKIMDHSLHTPTADFSPYSTAGHRPNRASFEGQCL